ncbi:MAG: acyltransferase [Burkholderiales bacterium]|nr:acyltransferase [Burkholderiales bacterium]
MSGAVWLTAPRLATLATGRANNFDLLRLLAAGFVVLFHCYALTGRWTDEPLWNLAHELNFGSIGVKIFFVISGFLVTRSWLRRASVPSFVTARVLRIYPALVAATLFTIILAGLSSPLVWASFLADPATLDFAWRVATGWRIVDQLPGAFAHNPFPDAANGSLWTLPIELRLYAVVLVAGSATLLRRRQAWLALVLGLTALFAVHPDFFPLAPNTLVVRELALLFGLGSLAAVWHDALPISLVAALVAVLLVAWNPLGLTRGALLSPLLAYVVLVAAYHPAVQWPRFDVGGDYSYGLYVYSFPIQQTLVERLPSLSPLAMFALALPISLAVAAASWHGIERPALRLKNQQAPLREDTP